MGIEQYFEYDEPKETLPPSDRGGVVSPYAAFRRAEEVCIASGSQNAMAVTLMSLFEAGDAIGADELTYSGFSALASMLGLRLVPVGADAEGMDPSGWRSLRRAISRGLYLMPECQNPTAVTLSGQRRRIGRRYTLSIG